MTQSPVDLDELLATRQRLIEDLHSRLDDHARRFLLSLHDGAPEFETIERPQAVDLPAVQWKRLNLKKLQNNNPGKHAAQRSMLEALFK